MDQSPATGSGDEKASESLPSFKQPVPLLLSGMDSEEATLTFGLGFMVREAAAVEYTLHSLLVHFAKAPRAYAHEPGCTGRQYATQCLKALEQTDKPVSEYHRRALKHDLELCRERFDERNRYVHGYLTLDEESQAWFTVKGSREKDAVFPEFKDASGEEVLDLAKEFFRLNQKLIAWDIEYFGEPGDPELGQPDRVSVKRISGRRP